MYKLGLYFVVLTLSACDFESKAPSRIVTNPNIEIEESMISLPISIDVEEIKSLLQQAINENSNGNQLFFESGRDVGGGVSIQTDVKKRGSVSVFTKDNTIEAHLPLHVDLRVDWEKCKRINLIIGSKRVCLKHHENTSPQFTVIVKLSPRLNADYKLEPNVNLDYSLDRGAQIKVGPIKINLVSKTREALSKQMSKFQQKLDSSLKNKINAKSYAESVWKLTQKPILVSKDENLWMLSDVSSLHATPLFTDNKSAHLGIGIKGKFSIFLGNPSNDIKLKPLPPLQPILPSKGIILNVPIFIDYSELEKQMNEKFKNYQLDYEGNQITIVKLAIFGASDGRLVVGTKVNLKSAGDWFGTTGWIYLLGNPIYNSAKSELSVRNVKYDVNTESILLDTAAWAASPFIIGKIEDAIVFNIEKDISKVKMQANKYMKGIEINNVGQLYGKLSSFSIGKIVIQRDALLIEAKASGSMSVKLFGL